MNCDAFWKRVITFCLTLGLGVIVSDLFISKETTSVKKRTVANLILIQRKCVPADENLKCHFLSEKEVKTINTYRGNESRSIKLEENRKRVEELKKQFYKPLEDRIQNQNLLHKEKCLESNGRK